MIIKYYEEKVNIRTKPFNCRRKTNVSLELIPTNSGTLRSCFCIGCYVMNLMNDPLPISKRLVYH